MSTTSIEELIEGIRSHPSMYVGDVSDGSGLLQLVWELVANSLDQHLAGRCSRIDVILEATGEVVVADDGPGIPLFDERGEPFAETALTKQHRTATFDGHAPHEHLGDLTGLGLFPVNVLSEQLTLEVFRDGCHHRQCFARGLPLGRLEDLGPTTQTGTRVTIRPDPAIFRHTWINAGTIGLRLRELSCLLPAMTFTLSDRREQAFHEPRGLAVMLERMRGASVPMGPALVIDQMVEDIRVEVALQWFPVEWSDVRSYANVARTSGGTHVDGLLEGIDAAMAAHEARRPRPAKKKRLERIKRGLHAVVCVRLAEANYGEPTKDRLETPRARSAVSFAVRRALPALLQREPELVALLLRR